MRGKNPAASSPPRYTMKHCRQTTIVMQMQQWARNWGWHGRCILVHYFYQSSRDIGSRRNNAFRHVVIVRSRRSRKPTAHLRPYEYGIPSFVPKDPSVSRAPFPSLLLPSCFHPLETSPRCKRGFEMSGGIEAIKIGQRSYCWNFIRKKLNLV